MVKPLTFKGSKPTPKRKRPRDDAPAPAPAPAAAPDEDSSWVTATQPSDLAGPVLLVLPALPAAPPTCLATDALGAVHASVLENTFEGQPGSAEPHLVAQVWVATRVGGGAAGAAVDVTFKGHHERFLGCDKDGALAARREAAGAEEMFRVRRTEGEGGGVFEIGTGRGGCIMVEEGQGGRGTRVRGDGEEGAERARVRIRMQARFQPRLRMEKAEKVRAKISRKELEAEVGRRLEDDEVRRLKKARREGDYHETMLDVKVKGKHDKFA